MASQNVPGPTDEGKSRDERLERLDELRNQYIGYAFAVRESLFHLEHTSALMAIDCSMKAFCDLAEQKIKQTQETVHEPELKKPTRRDRKPQNIIEPSWAKAVEGVLQ